VTSTPPVVVVGSGAAGLAAALAAAGSGADVLVLERAPTVGGTTAMSGGVVWMPAHGRAGGPRADTAEDALRYLDALCTGDVDPDLMAAFVVDARRVADEIEDRSPLEWEVLARWPDYRGELPGAAPGGRSLWPRPLRLAPDIEGRIQPAFDQPSPASAGDVPDNDGVVLRGHVRGRALAGGLLAGALDAGVEVRTGARVEQLVFDGDRVLGVVVDGRIEAGRVVLASGGFQHDPVLRDTHLTGPPVAPMGPAGCRGDGLRMATDARAASANMSEGWWMPAMHVPGESIDGVRHFRPLHGERAQPGGILVDGNGARFVDEAQNYGDVGRAIRTRAGTGSPGPVCWLVFDVAYRRRYPVGPLSPGDPDPEWLARAEDVEGLAKELDVAPEALAATVARFNAGATRGTDDDFGRGTRPYDIWIGDHDAAHPTLAPLQDGPYYALEVHLGCMGTKGGPRTDDRGRVQSSAGGAVPGLYAAGNAAASPFGSATAAGGATLGPALVFGYRAGEAAAGDR
jgi:3-oxosteroid 1-dehydrogenase